VRREVALVVTCEHGGNVVPKAYRALFAGHGKTLETHRAYDPGALDIARYLSRRFRSPLHYATHSRLLVELNRSLHHGKLFSEFTRPLEREEREDILERYYHPHRSRIVETIHDAVYRGQVVLHVASHTFTPVLAGVERTADVAWLYDPKRGSERRFVARWKQELKGSRPDLRSRHNYPYRGSDDGLTTYLRALFSERQYLGIELEVNQALYLGDRRQWRGLREELGDTLEAALAHSGRKR
jgi:predicted N-formylglutamate amidohydrolase